MAQKLTKITTAPSMPADDHRRYMAEDAMRTLSRAEAMRRDPQLMRDVRSLAETALKAVTGPAPMKSTKKPSPGNPGRAGLELGNKTKDAMRSQSKGPSRKINPLATKKR